MLREFISLQIFAIFTYDFSKVFFHHIFFMKSVGIVGDLFGQFHCPDLSSFFIIFYGFCLDCSPNFAYECFQYLFYFTNVG